MVLKNVLLPEVDREMAVTRRVLQRVPFKDADWKPHPTAMSLGTLAAHLVRLPAWAPVLLQQNRYDIAGGKPPSRATHATLEALLSEFDELVQVARALIVSTSDTTLLEPWTLEEKGHEVFTLPRIAAIRAFLLSHLIHHRGQLTVYLRLRGVPVPSIYRASAPTRVPE